MDDVSFDNVKLAAFKEIQKQLKRHETKLFSLEIESKYINVMPMWIEQEFYTLKDDSGEILLNVSRRLKNLIRNYDFEKGCISLKKRYLDFLKRECQLALPNEENRSKNMGLTKEEFKSLLAQLHAGDESLIEKVYLCQFRKCLAHLIRSYGCAYELAYESSMDALYEIRKDLLGNKILYGNLSSYFNRRAALVFFRKSKKLQVETVSLDSKLDYFSESPQVETVNEQYSELIKIAISKLGGECEKIIRSFYYEGMKLDEIANSLQKSHVSVRKQISRCRDKLRHYFSKEYYSSVKVK